MYCTEPSHKRRKTAQQISDRDALYALDNSNTKMGGKRRKQKPMSVTPRLPKKAPIWNFRAEKVRELKLKLF